MTDEHIKVSSADPQCIRAADGNWLRRVQATLGVRPGKLHNRDR